MLVINVDSFYKHTRGYALEQDALSSIGCELRLESLTGEDALCEGAALADVIIVEHAGTPLTRHVQSSLKKCRLIVKAAVGIDNIDLQAASDLGIVVAHIPHFCVEEVSDHAVVLIMACVRRIFQVDRHVRSGGWNEIVIGKPIHRLQTQTIGLVGFGRIARRVAEKFRGWGVRLIAYDPYLDAEVFQANGVERVALNVLLREADYVSLHVPLTESTRHLIGRNELALMRQHAFLINSSRGAVIDEHSLIEALQSGKIEGAALDVTGHEPLDKNSPLRELPNVLVSPHTGAYSVESIVDLRQTVLESIAAFLDGFSPPHVANHGAVAHQKLRSYDQWPGKSGMFGR